MPPVVSASIFTLEDQILLEPQVTGEIRVLSHDLIRVVSMSNISRKMTFVKAEAKG
jgi:hypothetical protein